MFRILFVKFALAFILLTSLCARVRAEELTLDALPIAGAPFEGKLIGVDSDWTLRFSVPGSPLSIPASELARWSTPAEPTRGSTVYLADGSVLLGDVDQIVDDRLTLQTDMFGDVDLPLQQIRGVILKSPSDQTKRDQLVSRIVQNADSSDRLVFRNGDELAVSFSKWKDSQVEFSVGAKSLKVKPQQLTAIFFNPKLLAKIKQHPFTAYAGFQDGTLLHLESLALDNKGFIAKLVGGQELESDLSEEICSLLPQHSKLTYLSDQQPHQYQHIPFLNLKWDFHNNQNVLGARLRSGGRLFQKGIGVHSGARLTYKLDQPYQRFQAEIALDDQAKKQGSAKFRVLTTDGKSWTEAFASPIVRGGDKPIPIDLDIRGARAIALVVDYADRGDVRDYANWLGARLVK